MGECCHPPGVHFGLPVMGGGSRPQSLKRFGPQKEATRSPRKKGLGWKQKEAGSMGLVTGLVTGK